MDRLYIADVGSFVYKGRSTGHYIPLAQNYVDVLSDRFQVIVAGGPSYKEKFQGEQLLLLPYDNPGNGFRNKIHLFKNCKKLFKEAEGGTIVLQQSSIVTAFIGIALFYKRKSKLFVIEYSTSSINSFIKKFIYRFAKNKINGILCPNEDVGKAFDRPYCIVPDYIYTGDHNMTSISYDEKKYDLCVVGRLAPEKGTIEVAKKYAHTDIKLLIAGRPQSKELGSEIENVCSNADNIELHLGYIEREDYEKYLQESRYSILNYQGEYSVRSSGVVLDTLFCGVPIIGKKCTALHVVEKYRCGFLYENIDDLHVESYLNPSMYNDFKNNICAYRETHVIYKNNLCEFLNNE